MRKGGVFPGRQFSLEEEDEDDDGDDTAAIERKVHGANMPEAALRICLKELKRSTFTCSFSFLTQLVCVHSLLIISGLPFATYLVLIVDR